MEKEKLKKDIVQVLKYVFDPEIPVNIYDLGLIYDIKIDDEMNVEVVMTLTAPGCPVADELVAEVKERTEFLKSVKQVTVTLTFEPAWEKSMMSEEALLELGFM